MQNGPTHDSSAAGTRRSPLLALARQLSPGWILAFAAAWWAVAKGVRADPVPLVLAIGVAGVLHAALGGARGPRLRIGRTLAFVPYFLRAGFAGGLDVARRALLPSLPLAPDLLAYSIRLPEGPARVLFVNCLSLLPGTFSAQLEGAALTVHVLARDVTGPAQVRELEERIAGIFGLELQQGEGTS